MTGGLAAVPGIFHDVLAPTAAAPAASVQGSAHHADSEWGTGAQEVVSLEELLADLSSRVLQITGTEVRSREGLANRMGAPATTQRAHQSHPLPWPACLLSSAQPWWGCLAGASPLNPLPLQVDVDGALMSAGIDSLAAVELKSVLEAAWQLELPSTLMFDYPSVRSMAGYIRDQLLQKGAGHGAAAVPGRGAPPDRVPGQLTAPELAPAPGYHQLPPPVPTGTAVLSLSARFPLATATDLGCMAAALQAGAEAVGPVPLARWDNEDLYSPAVPAAGSIYTRHGAFLRGVAAFDPALFSIGRGEALGMDPQHRLLLEESVVALVGMAAPGVADTGVYVGCMYQEYPYVLGLGDAGLTPTAVTGNSLAFMVGRISYSLGLNGARGCACGLAWECVFVCALWGESLIEGDTRDSATPLLTPHSHPCHPMAGPCMSTDTACSSSLVAAHLAHRDVLSASATRGLAAGTNLMLSPGTTLAICQLQVAIQGGRGEGRGGREGGG